MSRGKVHGRIHNVQSMELFCLRSSLTSENYWGILQGTITQVLENVPYDQHQNDQVLLYGALAPSSWNPYLKLTRISEERSIGPTSSDFTPWDFFCWGFIKNKAYPYSVNNLVVRFRPQQESQFFPQDNPRLAKKHKRKLIFFWKQSAGLYRSYYVVILSWIKMSTSHVL